MDDEKFVFYEDVREKKTISRGSRHKRTHAGKGGRVKFPSDYLSNKELKAMNGEVKSYHLNSPMLWSEFKSMPEDIQVLYIKGLREKYGVSTTKLAEMFGVSQGHVSHRMVSLGIGSGRNNVAKFDKDGWNKFVNGNCDDSSEDPAEVMQEAEPEAAAEQPEFAFEVPRSGVMTFVCPASSALDSVAQILGDTTVKIAISWEWVKDEDRVIDIG